MKKCKRCDGTLSESVKPRRYDIGLDESIVVLNAIVRECGDCGDTTVGIRGLAKLVKAVAEAVSGKPERLTPRELRFLRSSLGWSKEDAAERLRVSTGQISKWESGSRPIKETTELLLRMLARHESPTETYATKPSKPFVGRFELEAKTWKLAAG